MSDVEIDYTEPDIQKVIRLLANHDVAAVATLSYKLNVAKDSVVEAILDEPDQYEYNDDLLHEGVLIPQIAHLGQSENMLKLEDIASMAMLLAGYGSQMDDVLKKLVQQDLNEKLKLTKVAKKSNPKGHGRKGRKKTKRKGHKSKKSKKKPKGKRHGKSKKSRKGKKGRK
jgi:hypothetical protein